jgi:hypothetical protein
MSEARKLPGRPRIIHGQGSRVSTWVPADVHDRFVREAAAKAISVSAVVRTLLTRTQPLVTKK